MHNHVNGVFQCVAMRAPGFGDRRLHKLEDIAAISGGEVYSKHSGFTLETMTLEQLGRASPGAGHRRPDRDHRRRRSAEEVEFRVAQLRAELERATFGIDEDVLTERIGSLSGKVAVIRVGAPTNAELAELQHRVEDALSATRAAMAEGIVAGGGAALLHAERRLDDLEVDGDYATGVEIVRSVLTEPAYLIAANAGYSGAGGGGQGRSRWARTRASTRCEGRFGNMIEMGIIDPLRVCRSALQNGASVAGLLLTTNTLIAEEQTPWGGSRGADDRVRPAGRGPAPALAGLQHAAVARARPVGRLITGARGLPRWPRATGLERRLRERGRCLQLALEPLEGHAHAIAVGLRPALATFPVNSPPRTCAPRLRRSGQRSVTSVPVVRGRELDSSTAPPACRTWSRRTRTPCRARRSPPGRW